MREIANVVAPTIAKGKKENKVAAPRSPNYTKAEKILLTDLVDVYKNVIENKTTDMTTSKAKDEAWRVLAEAYNCQTTNGILRTADQLRACWATLKKHARTNRTLDNRSLYKTGGGPAEPTNLDDLDLRTQDICKGQFDPLDNPYDDDAEFILPKKCEDTLDLAMTSESTEMYTIDDVGDFVAYFPDERAGSDDCDFQTSELFPATPVRNLSGTPSVVPPPRGSASASCAAPTRPTMPIRLLQRRPTSSASESCVNTTTATTPPSQQSLISPDHSSHNNFPSTASTSSIPVRTSFFSSPQPAAKKRKVSEVREDLSDMAEARKLLAQKQLDSLEERGKREKEIHEIVKEKEMLLVKEKLLDIKIKEAQLRVLERELER